MDCRDPEAMEGNRSAIAPCIALPPVTHMDVGNGKAMLEHRNPSMQSSDAFWVPPIYGGITA
jgi:hypothetical protein